MGNKSSLITEPRVKHKYKLGPPFFNNSEKATAQTASAEFKHNSRARRNQSGKRTETTHGMGKLPCFRHRTRKRATGL